VAEEASGCRKCPLAETRTNVVFGSGKATVPIVFVGEAPGRDEDEQGLPFVGRAGQLLTRIITAMGLDRDEVYICNVLKCRPPNNRDPLPEEVAACLPYLQRQLELLKPRVICALGRHSAQALLGRKDPLSKVRGRVFSYQGIRMVPTYHPAALLRNPGLKRAAWEDVQKVRRLLDDPEAYPVEGEARAKGVPRVEDQSLGL
jgi:DNA polymerase